MKTEKVFDKFLNDVQKDMIKDLKKEGVKPSNMKDLNKWMQKHDYISCEYWDYDDDINEWIVWCFGNTKKVRTQPFLDELEVHFVIPVHELLTEIVMRRVVEKINK